MPMGGDQIGQSLGAGEILLSRVAFTRWTGLMLRRGAPRRQAPSQGVPVSCARSTGTPPSRYSILLYPRVPHGWCHRRRLLANLVGFGARTARLYGVRGHARGGRGDTSSCSRFVQAAASSLPPFQIWDLARGGRGD
jgi:hypothetical protein